MQTSMCPNGHILDTTWDYCPYCPSQPAAAPNPPAPATPTPATVIRDADGRSTVMMETVNQQPVVGWLVALNGKHRGQDFRIKEGRNIVGAGPEADIRLTDGFVSSVHAHLNYRERDGEKQFVLLDMDSTNGTYLNENEEPIAREQLVDNDTVIFGEIECRFKCL